MPAPKGCGTANKRYVSATLGAMFFLVLHEKNTGPRDISLQSRARARLQRELRATSSANRALGADLRMHRPRRSRSDKNAKKGGRRQGGLGARTRLAVETEDQAARRYAGAGGDDHVFESFDLIDGRATD